MFVARSGADAVLARQQCSFGAVADAEKFKNGGDVDLYRARGNLQRFADIGVALAGGDQAEDVALTRGQAGWGMPIPDFKRGGWVG